KLRDKPERLPERDFDRHGVCLRAVLGSALDAFALGGLRQRRKMNLVTPMKLPKNAEAPDLPTPGRRVHEIRAYPKNLHSANPPEATAPPPVRSWRGTAA